MMVRKSLHRHSRGGGSSPAGGDGCLLKTLGAVALSRRDDGAPPVWLLGPGKLVSLLTWVACTPGRQADTGQLIDLLWSDRDSATAHHDLRQAIWQLRRKLGRTAITCGRRAVALRTPIRVDREEFLDTVDRGALDQAVALYGGEFLPGVPAAGARGFEEWADLERYRLRRIFCRAAESLARQSLAAGRCLEAQQLASRVRDADPHDEAAWVLLLEMLLAAGDPVRAAAEADLLERVLATDGRVAQPHTHALLRRVRRAAERGPPAGAPATLAPALTDRDGELRLLLGAWEAARGGHGRHVHLIGGAGFGKTRLLLELQTRLLSADQQVLYMPARFPGSRVLFGFASELATALAQLPGSVGVSPAAAGALLALSPSLSTRFAVPSDSAGDGDALRRRALALLELVTVVSEEAPLALLCDDADWLDRASLDALAWVFTQLGGVRVLCVTSGTAAWPGAPALAEGVALAPMSLQAVHKLVSSIAPLPATDWARVLPEWLYHGSAGSPRSVLERLEMALEQGRLRLDRSGWSCPDPEALLTQLPSPAAAGPMPMLVAPFVGEAASVADEHLVDGLTEGVIAALSQIRALRVISRESAMRLKGTPKDTAVVARELCVRYVLEGHVRSAGDDIEIHADLVDHDRGAQVWSGQYTGTLKDVLDIQERMVRDIAAALRLRLSPEEKRRIAERPIENPHAYECYLRARHDMWLLSREALDRAVRHLKSGLELMGDNELLYATLGEAYVQYVNAGLAPPEPYLDKARECASKVFVLNPQSARGHVLSGFMRAFTDPPSIQDMVKQMKCAIGIDPNNPEALLWLIACYGISGKGFAARPFLERLLAVDPLPPQHQLLRGYIEALDGRFEESVAPLRKANEMDPLSLPIRLHYAMGLLWSGRREEADGVIDRLAQDAPRTIFASATSFVRYAITGDVGRARVLVTPELAAAARQHPLHPLLLAEGYALLRDRDQALQWLDTAVRCGFINYPFLANFDPLLANLRGDQRFVSRMEHVKHRWDAFEV